MTVELVAVCACDGGQLVAAVAGWRACSHAQPVHHPVLYSIACILYPKFSCCSRCFSAHTVGWGLVV